MIPQLTLRDYDVLIAVLCGHSDIEAEYHRELKEKLEHLAAYERQRIAP